MMENRPGDAVVGRHNEAARPARSFTTATLRLAANFAALEIARALGQSEPSGLERHVLALDLKTRNASEHFVRAQPDCSACGAPYDALDALEHGKAPLRLRSRPVSPEIDGGWRSLTAAEVVQRLGCHVSPVTGLISGLRFVPRRWLAGLYSAAGRPGRHRRARQSPGRKAGRRGGQGHE